VEFAILLKIFDKENFDREKIKIKRILNILILKIILLNNEFEFCRLIVW